MSLFMHYKYIHDAENRVVFRFPINPTVSEQKDNKGRRISWSVQMEIEITRADNRLVNNRWEHPIASFPQQHFEAQRYSQERVISYFHMHHDPRGEELSEDAYSSLKQEYETMARRRK